jgi:hypothetical protein
MGLSDTGRSSGENDPFGVIVEDILNRRLRREDDGEHVEFAYPPCDELRILRSKIQNDNGIVVRVHERADKFVNVGPE